MLPLVLFLTVLGIGAGFGMQTGVFWLLVEILRKLIVLIYVLGFAINPARDLGPRLLTAMVGYGGHGASHLGRTRGVFLTLRIHQYFRSAASTGSGAQSCVHLRNCPYYHLNVVFSMIAWPVFRRTDWNVSLWWFYFRRFREYLEPTRCFRTRAPREGTKEGTRRNACRSQRRLITLLPVPFDSFPLLKLFGLMAPTISM